MSDCNVCSKSFYIRSDYVPAVVYDMFNVLSSYGKLNLVVYEDDTIRLHILNKFNKPVVETTFIAYNNPEQDIMVALNQAYNILSDRMQINISADEGCSRL